MKETSSTPYSLYKKKKRVSPKEVTDCAVCGISRNLKTGEPGGGGDTIAIRT